MSRLIDPTVDLDYQNRTLTVPSVEGMVLYEIYDKNGHLHEVTSTLNYYEGEVGDYVIRREWATAAMPTLARVMPS